MGFWTRQALIALGLVGLALIVGLGVNFVRPEGLPLVQDWSETLARRAEERLPEGVAVLPPDRMAGLAGRADVVLLDARPRVFYELEHIPGAYSLPVEEAEGRIRDLLGRLGSGVRIVTYCGDPTCPAGRELAAKIRASGHPDVAVFLAGIEAWRAAGRPLAAGPDQGFPGG